MHIAVLVFGRLNKCAEHHENIMDSIGREHDIDFFCSSDNPPTELLNDFIRLYNPKLYINSPIRYDYDLGKYPGRQPETHIHNMTCHFINKNRVFLLLEEHIHKENVRYDCVISLRVDCLFHSRFIFNELNDNTIYIPAGNDYVGGINDQLAYGKIDVMKKYNSINPLYLLENRLSIPHPENLNTINIHYHNLNVKRPNIIYVLDK